MRPGAQSIVPSDYSAAQGILLPGLEAGHDHLGAVSKTCLVIPPFVDPRVSLGYPYLIAVTAPLEGATGFYGSFFIQIDNCYIGTLQLGKCTAHPGTPRFGGHPHGFQQFGVILLRGTGIVDDLLPGAARFIAGCNALRDVSAVAVYGILVGHLVGVYLLFE